MATWPRRLGREHLDPLPPGHAGCQPTSPPTWVEVFEPVPHQHGADRQPGRKGPTLELQQAGRVLGGSFRRDDDRWVAWVRHTFSNGLHSSSGARFSVWWGERCAGGGGWGRPYTERGVLYTQRGGKHACLVLGARRPCRASQAVQNSPPLATFHPNSPHASVVDSRPQPPLASASTLAPAPYQPTSRLPAKPAHPPTQAHRGFTHLHWVHIRRQLLAELRIPAVAPLHKHQLQRHADAAHKGDAGDPRLGHGAALQYHNCGDGIHIAVVVEDEDGAALPRGLQVAPALDCKAGRGGGEQQERGREAVRPTPARRALREPRRRRSQLPA